MALNKFICMGRLVADPELRKTQAGKSTTSFTIAIDRNYKDEQGNRPSDFVKIVAWDKTAELVCSYFKKGRMIAVTAEFRTNNWTDQQGNKRYDYYFEAREVSFCGDNQPANAGAAPSAPAQTPTQTGGYVSQTYTPQPNPADSYYQPSNEPVPHFETVSDDELPFDDGIALP